MSTIDLGNIKFNWKGTKDTSTAYAIDDVVYVDPHSYVCVQAHTNQAVNTNGNNAYWEIIASGANLPGQTGYAGKALKTDGTNLSWGTAGRVLKVSYAKFNNHWIGTGATNITITVTPVSSNSLMVVQSYIFGETGHDRHNASLRLNSSRSGYFSDGTFGETGNTMKLHEGGYTSNDWNSTPGNAMHIAVEANTSTSNITYKWYVVNEALAINGAKNTNYESASSWMVITEVAQ